MFNMTGNNGFHLTFANGWTASIQWEYGNYCDNRNNDKADKYSAVYSNCPSKNAEVAAWNNEDKWHHFEDIGDDVKGYLTADEVVKFLAEIAAK